jgi:Sir2 family
MSGLLDALCALPNNVGQREHMTTTTSIELLIESVRAWVEAATRVVVLTGAGISTESGIPDFRGPQGVWTKDPAAEKLSNIHYYLADPEIRKKAWQARLAHPAWSARISFAERCSVDANSQRTKRFRLSAMKPGGALPESGAAASDELNAGFFSVAASP